MKFIFTISLICGFLWLAVFGIFAMSHSFEHSHNGCIASTARGIDCPKEEDIFSFLAFHLSVFKIFSTATFGNGFTGSMILLAAVMLLVIFGVFVKVKQPQLALAISSHNRQLLESYFFSYQRKFVRWLSLHENSPSFV